MNIRNIAIIAHVDHGKSTLVDNLLKQSDTDLGKVGEQEHIMDSNELEQERGITIFSKNAAAVYNDTKINIIDTPGHADFGGEVERVLNMADGALLLVDAQEGPMPQTRFVLKKALAMGHKIIVIINKIDKKNARVNYALDKVIELFIELGATNEQLNFPIVYAAAKLGKAGLSPELEKMVDLKPIFETVLKYVPTPQTNTEGPLQIMITSIIYDNYKGKIGVGRISQGKIQNSALISHISRNPSASSGQAEIKKCKITGLFVFSGLSKIETAEAFAGDIAAIAGIENINIGDTISDADNPLPLPPIQIEKPTVKMIFSVNNSPFSGQEGQYCTSRNLKERLEKELDNDVALRVEAGKSPDEFIVSGRGELHLGILIEKMRREGYELQVSRPEVIMQEKDGKTLEPAEDVWIEAPEQYSGTIIEKMSRRKGEMKNMNVENGFVYFHFFIPTRGLIGFRNEFLIDTKGNGIINALFAGYHPKYENIHTNPHGSLIAHEAGASTAYALLNSQERGEMFIGPGVKVYEGQIVGQNAKAEDLTLNVCKQKQLTNFRAKTDAVTDDLIPPRQMSLEQCLEYLGDDELLEVTPLSLRLRKRILKNSLRK
ncbi:MAG: GTP-binding protein TypA [Candidatus Harrisonbacteria bacterium RIFCSPLOWO2_02_FULL_41_11]|uniref:50S ribosomal subunit assembly factor BipA n=1 Tax=Candidatus Harrisonbacteria bacterium RIFCSPHIGHO2_02_FULL_42_16 TaxID=1798404 RepID=A0A1G1ZJ87_9BACT|nr:MAG: GTP-binding protein TypA [Candidatus Harrisonbacteria bacterium RIFCSPHIGHO2_02_FULL_42_16]OGY67545.1 MAG: GTP-binding protein TypA [Candidatus Harrisonbacteria bacterium RIFCSPLOWO2_02_FULL_41_11]